MDVQVGKARIVHGEHTYVDICYPETLWTDFDSNRIVSGVHVVCITLDRDHPCGAKGELYILKFELTSRYPARRDPTAVILQDRQCFGGDVGKAAINVEVET